MPTRLSREEFLNMIGREDGPTNWFHIDQKRVDLFAEATEDRQFIHIDPEKASRTPLGGTVAHGFLSLSLLSALSAEICPLPEGMTMAINYGLNKVRFPNPVRVGSDVRLRMKVAGVEEKKPGQILVTTEATLEIRGEERPALVAETLAMYFIASPS